MVMKITFSKKSRSYLPVQTNPLPVYPGSHVHANEPGKLTQVAFELQGLKVSHSEISEESQN